MKYNLLKAEICVESNNRSKSHWFKLANYQNHEEFQKAYQQIFPHVPDYKQLIIVDHSQIPYHYDNMWSVKYLFPLINIAKSLNDENAIEAFGVWIKMKDGALIPNNIEKDIDEDNIKKEFILQWQGKHESLKAFYIKYLDKTDYFKCISNETKRNEIEGYFDHENYAESQEINSEAYFERGHVFLTPRPQSN